jgi:hypothetical protein
MDPISKGSVLLMRHLFRVWDIVTHIVWIDENLLFQLILEVESKIS